MSIRAYKRPAACLDAVAMLSDCAGSARIIAGGTDLNLRIKRGNVKADTLIDITRIPSLSEILRTETGVSIGSCVKLHELAASPVLTGSFAALAHAAGEVSCLQIRNVATLGGNVCNASPSADTVPALIVLGAEAIVLGPLGQRRISMESLYRPEGGLALAPNEMLTHIFLPAATTDACGAYYRKYAIRGSLDIAIVGAAAYLETDALGVISKARIALSSVGPRALRIPQAEAYLLGREPATALFAEAAEICRDTCTPISDQRASASYRREMAEYWAGVVLSDAAAQCKAGMRGRHQI